MTRTTLPVTQMFLDLINQGFVKPQNQMEDLRLPGEFVSTPLITTYGTPSVAIVSGVQTNAKLVERS